MTESSLFERAIVGLVGASLSVNGWLLASRVTDLNDTLRSISTKIGTQGEDIAAIKAEVLAHTETIAHLQRINENLRNKDN